MCFQIFFMKTICLWKKSLSSCWKHGIIVKNVFWLCLSYFFNCFSTWCENERKSDLSVHACNFSRKKEEIISVWSIFAKRLLCFTNFVWWTFNFWLLWKTQLKNIRFSNSVTMWFRQPEIIVAKRPHGNSVWNRMISNSTVLHP